MRIEKACRCATKRPHYNRRNFKAQPYSAIAAGAFISESAVKYRIKRLLNISGYSESEQLREIFHKYVSGGLNQ